MKFRVFAPLVFGWALSAFGAETPESVIVAAMRLSDASSYRWVTTVVDDARTYEIHGQTAKGGYTRVKMPIVNSVRRRLGRSVTDTEIEAIFKGNVKCVFETEDGWQTMDELPPIPIEMPTSDPPTALLGMGVIPPAPPKPKNEEGYSNLQLAIAHPHEDLGVIVTSHADLRFEDGTVVGTLNGLGAQLLLVHDGQNEITPLQASGTFKLWIRAGIVTRYQVQLEGVLAVHRKRIRVHQTSDTILSDVGTAKFDVPSEAQRKLGI